MKQIKILIYEPSEVISVGIKSVIKQIWGKNVDIYEVADYNNLPVFIMKYQPDILLTDLSVLRLAEIKKIKKQSVCKNIAIQHSLDYSQILSEFDEVISIFDTTETIKTKISKQVNLNQSSSPEEALTIREQEVLVRIVNGLTNKEIADNLNLSVHTITTHRRNISTKLQIHTVAGLTIYAISNKMINK